MMISGTQSRIARGLLGWSLATLAIRCRMGETTIRFEIGRHQPPPFKVLEIRRALEAAGVEFERNSENVRLKEQT
jgi:hypothetical protein